MAHDIEPSRSIQGIEVYELHFMEGALQLGKDASADQTELFSARNEYSSLRISIGGSG
jgi:hypothetical protein